ncbi:hypothetical protein H6G41_22870 [Tolypothrix sp. FACHB-123]|uniref:DUF6603 domain-containing protein n=1 Tax=Tolypothrix sp. FACHB-123 TaxID=2692868 RepID=UPI001688BDCC|nr:DUF6603 domain-containing protein [Tolypothrix sp. FACHB-123]MBD2357426.1 hypothetical protein [Tolypothrix sp. FACHB-123]
MTPTVKLRLDFELKASDTLTKLVLETMGEDMSFLKGNISSQSSMKIKDLVGVFDVSLATSIPDEIKITLNELLLILAKASNPADQSSKILLISLDLGTAINLSNLPLIGKEFSGSQTLAIENFKIIYASGEFTPNPAIKEVSRLSNKENKNEPIPQGLRLSAAMKFGSNTETLDITITEDKKQKNLNSKDDLAKDLSHLRGTGNSSSSDSLNKSQETSSATIEPAQNSDTAKWFDLKKNFGPVYFKRVGVQYQNSEVWFLLDASISAAGLTLTLDGLAVGSPITQFNPKFNLRGLGIEYESKGAISIGGALLRSTVNGKDEYSGAILIKTETFTLSAIASYTTTTEGHPSLFIYGILDKPLGGVPFFFVTGLALAFAYNRSLILPTLDEIPQFPLVRAALDGGKADVDGLIKIQQDLNPYIPPKVGQVMLAIGVKFTSFKIVESFVLLVATFGDGQFALDVIGISTLISPPVIPGIDPSELPPPIAQIRLAILARFVPAEGTLKVDGKILPDSYLFERNCQISGGFAFYSWFNGEHEGDFVLTVGGYHPRFVIPPHYPKVDPLSLNWRINNELSLKGNVYFALTASAIMAGGRLEAVWQSGNLKAWFIANAHFIVAWKPYAYDAQISVNLGASYTFDEKIFGIRVRKTFSFDLGAKLHIWGPEFSGTATIDLKITSFTIAFGSRSQKKPDPISWSEFKKSFLPADNQICTIAVESGLRRKVEVEKEEIFIVNPKEFILTTSSVIPVKSHQGFQAETITLSKVTPATSNFGIAPMNVSNDRLTKSEYSIYITKNGQKLSQEESKLKFVFIPIVKNIPSGLWSESNTNDPNRKGFIENVLSGYTIKSANPPTPGATQSIDQDKLDYGVKTVNFTSQWQLFSTFTKNPEDDENNEQIGIKNTILSKSNNRDSLLQSLDLSDIVIDLDDFKTNEGVKQAFVIPPQLIASIA